MKYFQQRRYLSSYIVLKYKIRLFIAKKKFNKMQKILKFTNFLIAISMQTMHVLCFLFNKISITKQKMKPKT